MGEFITLGNRKAVARVMKVRLHGWPAWVLRRAYYLTPMPTRQRRLHLLLDWSVGLLVERDISQLGTEQQPSEPLARAAAGVD